MIAVVKKYRERLRFELEMMVGIKAADDGFIKKKPLPSHRLAISSLRLVCH
jgi:hypothetical protein